MRLFPAAVPPGDSEQSPLLPAVRPRGWYLFDGIISLDEATAPIDQRCHVADAAGQIVHQLSGVEAKDVPALLFQEVVAGIVVGRCLELDVPGIAVALNINVAVRT